MKIFIDGDGSPVKDEAIEISLNYQLETVIVTSIDHYSRKDYPSLVSVVYVDKGSDAADYRIIGLIKSGDIVVTQDYGLASLALQKGAAAIHQKGTEYTPQTIDLLLEQRHFSGKIRKSGGRTKGPKPFTKEDREQFKESLSALIQKNKSSTA